MVGGSFDHVWKAEDRHSVLRAPTLQDAKDWKGWPIADKIGEKIRRQARNQLAGANRYGLKMQWVVSNRYKAEQLQAFFAEQDLNIQVLYVPKV